MNGLRKFFLCILGLALTGSYGCMRHPSHGSHSIKSTYLEKKDYSNDYQAYNSPPTIKELGDFIIYSIDSLSAPADKTTRYQNLIDFYQNKNKTAAAGSLAKDIIEVCNCFHLDIYYFTGLIKRVSNSFDIYAATSNGIAGISQFNEISVKEVSHLLGIPRSVDPGSNYGNHITLFYSDILRRCLKASSWFPYWDNRQQGESNKLYQKIKSQILQNPRIAMALAGVLLNQRLGLTLRGKTGNPDAAYRKSFNKYISSSTQQRAKLEKESADNTYDFVSRINAFREKSGSGLESNIKLLKQTGYELDIASHRDENAVINYHDSSFQVRELQATLQFRGLIDKVDGIYDEATASAVCKALGLKSQSSKESFCQKGWSIHYKTWYQIMLFTKGDISRFKSEVGAKHGLNKSELEHLNLRVKLVLGDGIKQNLDRKKYVYLMQRMLQVRGINISPDGKYNPNTKNKLHEYLSKRYNLKNLVHMDHDGSYVDEKTWQYLYYEDDPFKQ